MDRRWSIALFVVTAAAMVLVAFAPSIATSECSTTDTGGAVLSRCDSRHVSLVDREGQGVALVLAVPVIVTGAALLARSGRAGVAVAITLTVLAVLGLASIGMFLLPTVLLAWLAVYKTSARSAAK